MKSKICKTVTVAIVALGASAAAAEPANITFGSNVGQMSVERQSQIEASKSVKLQDGFLISREPPHCPRSCSDWRIVQERQDNRDMSLAEDMGSMLS